MAVYVVAGGGGFIGSNITEHLLRNGEDVRVLDNFATGRRSNLAEADAWAAAGGGAFKLVEGDIRDDAACDEALAGADYVMLLAAIPSVPRSVEDPVTTNDVNVRGTLCVLDSKANAYSQAQGDLIEKLRNLIQSHLELIYANHELGEQNRKLADIAGELGRLRRLVPICCVCKNVREDDGYWASVETYMHRVTGSSFTHGLCPKCYDDQIADL